MRICRSRNRKLCKMPAFQTPSHFIFMYYIFCDHFLSYLYSPVKNTGNYFLRKSAPRSRLYLFYAFHYSRISFYYQRNRPCKTGHAFRHRTTYLFYAHYNSRNHDCMDSCNISWIKTCFLFTHSFSVMAMDFSSPIK